MRGQSRLHCQVGLLLLGHHRHGAELWGSKGRTVGSWRGPSCELLGWLQVQAGEELRWQGRCRLQDYHMLRVGCVPGR